MTEELIRSDYDAMNVDSPDTIRRLFDLVATLRAKLADTQERLSDAEYSLKFTRNHRDELGKALTQARAEAESLKREALTARNLLSLARGLQGAEKSRADAAEAALREAKRICNGDFCACDQAAQAIDAYFTTTQKGSTE